MNKITTPTCSQSLGSLMRNAWVWNMIWIRGWGVGWSGCVAVCGVGADFPERKGGSNPQGGSAQARSSMCLMAYACALSVCGSTHPATRGDEHTPRSLWGFSYRNSVKDSQ